MNILVVDDEYYIVKNIIETTDWSALGIEQAFPAYSASQAKRIFEGSQDIDILLTDIEMPRETGLQLVEWLHENNFHPIVLVLTGHQRFDYAQEALNLHIYFPSFCESHQCAMKRVGYLHFLFLFPSDMMVP